MIIVGVTVAAVAILHLSNLKYWVIFVEFLMIRSTPNTKSGVDLIITITIIKSALSELILLLQVRTICTISCLELHQNLLELIIVIFVLFKPHWVSMLRRQKGKPSIIYQAWSLLHLIFWLRVSTYYITLIQFSFFKWLFIVADHLPFAEKILFFKLCISCLSYLRLKKII